MPKHFLQLIDLSSREIHLLIDHSIRMKQQAKETAQSVSPLLPLRHKNVILIFEKPSTRTRLSFQIGIHQLGGHAVVVDSESSQLGRGEPTADSARVMSRYCDMIMMRTFTQHHLELFAQYASVPIINGLTNEHHPCQILADLMTWQEHQGSFEGRVAAWFGDANNVCRSWMQAAKRLSFKLRISTPEAFSFSAEEMATEPSDHITYVKDPKEAAEGADLIITDSWVSMGFEDSHQEAKSIFAPWQVNEALMRLAHRDAIFMHCLPAYHGEEVSEAVLESAQSVVWDEAENRLHIQKSLMEYLMLGILK